MNKENKAKNKLIKFLKNKNIYCLYAFIISSLLAFLSFYINGMVNNNSIFFRSDMIEGIAYIKDFARCILNHENVYFSFNSGLGLNNSFNIACDVLSPFNLLYLFFFCITFSSSININIVSIIFIILHIIINNLYFFNIIF